VTPPRDGLDTAVRLQGVSKTYGGTPALKNVDMTVRRGTVHALLGGNGSGKSTLIKILAGVVPGDSGEIVVDGQTHLARHLTPESSSRLGFRFVHQDLALIDDMTIAENVALGDGFPVGLLGGIAWRSLNTRVAEMLEQFEVGASPTDVVAALRPAQRTMVAVARALSGAPRGRSLLVLDEPTASLPDHEVDVLLGSLKRRAAQGDTIIYVSHRLHEIRAISDEVTVLRDGSVGATLPASHASEERLVELIAGRPVDRLYPDRARTGRDGTEVLRVDDLHAGRLRGVSMSVGYGEIVGVAGLVGAGKSTLLRAVFGLGAGPERGTVTVGGRSVHGLDATRRMCRGVGYVPEDRVRDALLPDLSVRENLSVTVLERHCQGGMLHKRAERRSARTLTRSFGVKADSIEQNLGSLSGGNQQKVILARWLQREPQLLLLDEPTQGVDVVARADIYEILAEAARNGAGVLIASSDHEELAHVCDRVLVLHAGRLVADVSTQDIDARGIVALTYQAVNNA
jgi:ribose transport system ATP-binding protein